MKESIFFLLFNLVNSYASPYLYVTSHAANSISSYQITKDGDLIATGKSYQLPDAPEDMGTYEDQSGNNKFIFLAYYNLNKIAVWRAEKNGNLSLVSEYNTVTNPDPISGVLDNNYLYVNSAQVNQIDGFKFNNQTGQLTRLSNAPFNISDSTYGYAFSIDNNYLYEQYINNNQFAAIPVSTVNGKIGGSSYYVDSNILRVATGAKPMHYTTYNGYLYVNSTGSNGLSVYKIEEGGKFTPFNTYSSENIDYKYSFTPLRMARSNSFLYVTDTANNINVFSINPDHHVSLIQTINCGGALGRSPVFTYPGYAYQPILNSNQISAYKVDANTGKLTLLKTYLGPISPFHIAIFNIGPTEN